MQADTDELVIEITPDEAPEVTVEKPAGEKPDKAEAKTAGTAPIEPIEDLRKQFDDMKAASAARIAQETTARQNAEAEAATAREEAVKAKTEAVDSSMSALENAIDAAKALSSEARREYQAAMEAGDFAKAGEAQEKIASAQARLIRLDEGKADLEARKTEEPKPVPRQVQQRTEAPDPFERAISGTPPKAQAWLRAHPEFVTDPTLNRKANAAHNMALADGHAPETDGYFDYCEKFLGLKEEPAVKTNGAAKPSTAQRTKSMPAAPVSREAVSMNGSLTPTQVTLTKGEALAATDGTHVWNYDDPKIGAKKGEPIGVREMAKRKLALQKQGAYDRSFTEA